MLSKLNAEIIQLREEVKDIKDTLLNNASSASFVSREPKFYNSLF